MQRLTSRGAYCLSRSNVRKTQIARKYTVPTQRRTIHSVVAPRQLNQQSTFLRAFGCNKIQIRRFQVTPRLYEDKKEETKKEEAKKEESKDEKKQADTSKDVTKDAKKEASKEDSKKDADKKEDTKEKTPKADKGAAAEEKPKKKAMSVTDKIKRMVAAKKKQKATGESGEGEDGEDDGLSAAEKKKIAAAAKKKKDAEEKKRKEEAKAKYLEAKENADDLMKLWLESAEGLADFTFARKELNQMTKKGQYKATTQAYNILIKLAPRFDSAHKLFTDYMKIREEEMRRDLKPTYETYEMLFDLCNRGKKVQEITTLLNEMETHGLQPRLEDYNTVIMVLGKHGKIRRAMDYYIDMQRDDYKPSPYTYALMLAICAKNDKKEEAAIVLRQMKMKNLEADTGLMSEAMKKLHEK